MLDLLVALLLAGQQPPAPPPTTPAPAAAPAQTPRRAAPAPSTLQVRVTDRSGTPASGVRVTAEGPSSREGLTDASGALTFRTVTAGTYRLRAEGGAFITFEKEAIIRGGAPTTVELALSATPPAPEPEAPPPPASVITPSTAPAGEPKVLSIVDLAERSLSGRDPVRRVAVGCSGLSNAELLVIRESLQTPSAPDVDTMLYLVAGEAALNMGGRDQVLTNGWFGLVPRGTVHTLTRRGRNPVIILSIADGQPCAAAAAPK